VLQKGLNPFYPSTKQTAPPLSAIRARPSLASFVPVFVTVSSLLFLACPCLFLVFPCLFPVSHCLSLSLPCFQCFPIGFEASTQNQNPLCTVETLRILRGFSPPWPRTLFENPIIQIGHHDSFVRLDFALLHGSI
jgi:hypothetical protein